MHTRQELYNAYHIEPDPFKEDIVPDRLRERFTNANLDAYNARGVDIL